ncbi:MAG: methylenetetrahydrofolate reductase [NAD(P)H] [Prevotellaceae bacterium]|jgi:methylenetetrahydrofolate reductase (NADPH)|nr:methylenetetrahydrofolate reductase [NAD(P)H] [Prevotellaceae bacterium]
MKLTNTIHSAASTLFTFELMPPLKGTNFDEIAATVEQLMPYNPAYINITHHRAEVVMRELPSGLFEKRVVKKRAGTVSIAAAIKYKYGVEVVPHLVCGGYSRSEIEDMLIDFSFLGIENVLALRGDPALGERTFTAERDGYEHAIDLVRQVANMNRGMYLLPDMQNVTATSFCCGVAGYPEKHCEAPNFEADLQQLKAKVDAGAEYVATQMFFDNKKYFDFVNACRAAGISVPIIPGIKPFATAKQLTTLPQIFHIDLPDALVAEVQRCRTPQAVRQVGVEWCVAQCAELKRAGVPALHFYTMGKADNVEGVVKRIF